jgi:hypothetical protein
MEVEMKRYLAILTTGIMLLGFAGLAWGQCPGQPQDSGECDTLYVEVYPPDTLFNGFARVLILVTHDVPDPSADSLAAMDVPLCFTRTNPSRFCSVSSYWNRSFLYPYPPELLERSVFRHIIQDGDTIIHNWMMDQSQLMTGAEWDKVVINLDDTSHFWFHTAWTALADQHFGEGSRVLLATMTFRMQDTMTICIDSCFWPPVNRLIFAKMHTGYWYIPRHNLPYCFSLSYAAVGDLNADGTINVGDVVYLINYLYRASPTPVPTPVGDVNCDGIVDLGDIVFLINYLFKGGPPPPC